MILNSIIRTHLVSLPRAINVVPAHGVDQESDRIEIEVDRGHVTVENDPNEVDLVRNEFQYIFHWCLACNQYTYIILEGNNKKYHIYVILSLEKPFEIQISENEGIGHQVAIVVSVIRVLFYRAPIMCTP